MYDAILTNFPRLAGERDDAPRIQRAIDAAPNGILEIPKGDYDIETPLFIRNRCSLRMHPAARLIARKEMDFILTYDGGDIYRDLTIFEEGKVYDNLGLFIEGGDLEGQGLASCLKVCNVHHFTLSKITCHNGKKYGLAIKDGKKAYEVFCNNIYCKCYMQGLSGNIGIYSDCCDNHYTDCIVVDYTVGMRMDGGANRLTRCHIWGGTVAPPNMTMEEWTDLFRDREGKLPLNHYLMEKFGEDVLNALPEMLENSIAFDLCGTFNVLDGCYADTAMIGYRINAKYHTRLINCDFFNNANMGLKKSTAIVHEKGTLAVMMCAFRNLAGTEILYEGIKEGVEWIANDTFRFEVPEFLK